jgi:hypothetical protein
MPQYTYTRPAGLPGMLSIWDDDDIDSLVVATPTQQDQVPIGGTDDGDYWVQIQGEEGTFTIKFTASGNTAIEIADGLAADAASQVGLTNIVSTASTVGTPLVLDFIHPGASYAVSFPSNPGGNMSLLAVQSPDGSPIRPGYAIASDDGLTARPVKVGDTAAQFWGTACRNSDLLNPNAGLNGRDIQFMPADMVSACASGEMWVPVETAVAVNDPVFFRVNATGSQVFGAYGNTADGGNAVQVVGRFKSKTTAPGQLARVRLANP